MDVLLSGLNSYVGRKAASHLMEHGFTTYGLVRDSQLFETRVKEPVTAKLFNADLLKGLHRIDTDINEFHLAIYFPESPFYGDRLGLQVELIRLKNFVKLLQKLKCNRILFVARLIDKDYLGAVRKLFLDLHVRFTIILQNMAIGPGSLGDRYFRELLMRKVVFYDISLADIKFNPVYIIDVFKWLRSIDWMSFFVDDVIEFGGLESMSIRDLFRMYKKVNMIESRGFGLPHFLFNFLVKRNNLFGQEDYDEIKRMFKFEYPINNDTWSKVIPFSFTPLESIIKFESQQIAG